MKEIKISTETIKLDQLLKFASVVQTGGQAKMLIRDGLVKVNGSTIKTRGTNINKGDIIEIEDIDKLIVI